MRHRPILPVVATVVSALLLATVPVWSLDWMLVSEGEVVVDRRDDRAWTADPAYVLRAGLADRLIVTRAEAHGILRQLNRGDVENFGIHQWRWPTRRELAELRPDSLVEGIVRVELDAWLAGDATADASVFLWPVVVGKAASTEAAEAAVLAQNSVDIDRGTVVSGDVIVNDASPGPTLTPGFELSLDRTATIVGDAKADTVELARDSSVTGALEYNSLSGTGSAGTLSTPLSLPVLVELPQFQSAFPRPEAPDVLVATGTTLLLDAGDYGDVVVEADGTLVLSGGLYQAESLVVVAGGPGCPSPCGEVRYESGVDVRLVGKLAIGAHAYVGSAAGSGAEARHAVFYVGGIDGTEGSFGALPPATNFGQSASAHATFYTPNGTTRVERNAVLVGALLGRDIELDRDVSASADSFFGNQPPVAFPQSVATAGAGTIVVTLEGNDPEGTDLSFAIAVDPAFGTLANLTPIDPPPVEDPLNPGTFYDPPITQATVEYTPSGGGDVEDSFTFQVTDQGGLSGLAVIGINPNDSTEPGEPVTTVVAFDGSAETAENVPVVIALGAEAPCDGACDGAGADGDSPLTFSIPAGAEPAGGTLGTLIQGSEVPRRSASTTYTPNAGFSGSDSFEFQACGEVATVEVCDTATVTVAVVGGLAEDVTITTEQNQAVVIALLGTPGASGQSASLVRDRSTRAPVRRVAAPRRVTRRAVALDAAEIAGNVADSTSDGLGDNHNEDLNEPPPNPAPVLMSAGVQQAGGAGSNGTVRMQVEWELTGVGCPDTAAVVLSTNRGTVDVLPTSFFAGTEAQDGALSDDDFEAPAALVLDGVLPVSMPVTGSVGVDGTFSFDVTEELRAAQLAGLGHFSVSGRVDENVGAPARGLQVYTTADSAVADDKQPQLWLTTPPLGSLVFQIESLPVGGLLTDVCGTPILSVPHTLSTGQVRFVPAPTFFGTTSFVYRGIEGTVSQTALVTIVVEGFSCEQNGRDPECAPGG